MTTASLDVQTLSVQFSGLMALDQLSLRLAEGEILGLIGPNGSGKTTCVNAITGQVPIARGQISLKGQSLSGLTPREIALAGVMRSFQIVRLFDDLSVQENVEISTLVRGTRRLEAHKKSRSLLEMFGLWDRAEDLAGDLSYGQKRRVEIARALIANPHFLLLDEPAAGMNEQESADLMTLLSDLPKAYGLGLLIIDHDMHLITQLCHRVHVIASGQTIAEGSAAEVIQDPAVISAYLGTAPGEGDKRGA